jgi:short subunit dehydrogenase-like uncharacterized protein
MDENSRPSVLLTAEGSFDLPDTIIELVSLIMALEKDGIAGISLGLVKRYLETLVDFDKQFKQGASTPDHVLSISDIERLISTLVGKQVGLANELAWEKVKMIDELPLIEKKKKSTLKKT